jgi:hypothetical protein
MNRKNFLEQTCDLGTHLPYSVTPRPATGLIQPGRRTPEQIDWPVTVADHLQIVRQIFDCDQRVELMSALPTITTDSQSKVMASEITETVCLVIGSSIPLHM